MSYGKLSTPISLIQTTQTIDADNVQAGKQVWECVNMLLRLEKRWSV